MLVYFFSLSLFVWNFDFLYATTALPASKLDAEKDKIVAFHNEKRKEVKPPATNMPDLKWDDNLARLAQAWSDRCVFEHGNVPELKDTPKPDGQPPGQTYGETPTKSRIVTGQNLAAGWPTRTWKGSITSWDDEKKDFNYCRNKGSGVTGHYTQVVWAESLYVGCGKAKCPNLDGFGAGEFITCNYWPPGNFRGKKPYESQGCSGREEGEEGGGGGGKGKGGAGSGAGAPEHTIANTVFLFVVAALVADQSSRYPRNAAMFSFFRIFLFISAFYFLCVTSALPASKLDGEKENIVALHNQKRNEVKPPATNMQDLKWDDNLARLAQAWSDGCVWEHGNVPELKDVLKPDGKTRYGKTPTKGRIGTGQNMAAGVPTRSWKDSINAWDAEKSDYDYCHNKKSGVTGHYTQVVWAESEYVGCGNSTCSAQNLGLKMGGTRTGDFIVCNYWPPGNVNGRRPYEAEGDGCSGGTSIEAELRKFIVFVGVVASVIAALV